jgi:ribosomal protein L11 methyltransferase
LGDPIQVSADRLYPALDVEWPEAPAQLDRDRLLAVIDDHAPTAVEDSPFGARVFFASSAARDRAASAIAAALAVNCSPIDVSDESWAERSQVSLPPVRVGSIVITTSGVTPGVDLGCDTRGRIIIRPSMGFGTGHHASTRLCLSLLQKTPLDGATVLDIGTGSGVLAIAALKLAAVSVRAIDHDADAIHSARENLELNQTGDAIALLHCDLTELARGPRADLITANLTGTHLIAASATISDLAGVDGRLILGGLQADEEEDVRRAFASRGWAVRHRAEEDHWVGLLLERASDG